MSWDPFGHLAFPRDEQPQGSSGASSTGEKPGRRDALERVAGRLRGEGIPNDKARTMARDTIRRLERKGKI